MANDKQASLHVHDFLKYITDKYPTYWLTTHCKGDASYTISHLSQWLEKPTLELAKKIKPTNWITSKTEAIDWDTPFLWFDDYLFDFEKKDLIKHKVLDSWIEVDLAKNPAQLLDFLNL